MAPHTLSFQPILLPAPRPHPLCILAVWQTCLVMPSQALTPAQPRPPGCPAPPGPWTPTPRPTGLPCPHSTEATRTPGTVPAEVRVSGSRTKTKLSSGTTANKQEGSEHSPAKLSPQPCQRPLPSAQVPVRTSPALLGESRCSPVLGHPRAPQAQPCGHQTLTPSPGSASLMAPKLPWQPRLHSGPTGTRGASPACCHVLARASVGFPGPLPPRWFPRSPSLG